MPKKILLKLLANKKPLTDFNFKQIKSVLIRPIGYGLGDAILLTAVLKQLKQAYPDIRTGVFAINRNAPVFNNNPFVDEVLQDKPLTYLLNRGKWQVFMDYVPTFTTKNIFCDFLLKPQHTICFEKTAKKHYSHKTVKNYDFYVPDLAKTHLSRSLTLTPFKDYVNTANVQYTLPPLPKESENKAKSFLRKNALNILVCPKGSDRIIKPEETEKILTQIKKTIKKEINFIFPYSKETVSFKNINICFTGSLDIYTFFALVKNAGLVLSIDSAPVHAACAYKVPVLGLYSGWQRNFTLFAPLANTPHRFLCSVKKIDGHIKIIDGLDTAKAADFVKELLPLNML